MPRLNENGTVDGTACEAKRGVFEYLENQVQEKAKAKTLTWEDSARYHQARAEWAFCLLDLQKAELLQTRQTYNVCAQGVDRMVAEANEFDQLVVRTVNEYEAKCAIKKMPVTPGVICSREESAYTCARDLFRAHYQKPVEAKFHLKRAEALQVAGAKDVMQECLLDRVKQTAL